MDPLVYPYPKTEMNSRQRIEAMLVRAQSALETVFDRQARPALTAKGMSAIAESALKDLKNWDAGGKIPIRWIWPGRRTRPRLVKKNRNR